MRCAGENYSIGTEEQEKQDEMRGEVKVEVIKGDAICSDVRVCSVYDTKLVHMISTLYRNVKWTPTKNKFYIKTEKKTVEMRFHPLNIIHMYNFGMGSVDVLYQICIQYRPYHWMLSRNWWWSVFHWELEGAAEMHTSHIGKQFIDLR